MTRLSHINLGMAVTRKISQKKYLVVILQGQILNCDYSCQGTLSKMALLNVIDFTSAMNKYASQLY